MIPISDDNPTLRFPAMTVFLLAVTWLVWIFGQGALEGILYVGGRDGLALAANVWSILVRWFATQVLTGLPQLMMLDPEVSGGVAVWAHVGGFVAGLLLVRGFHDPQLLRRRTMRGDAQVVWQ